MLQRREHLGPARAHRIGAGASQQIGAVGVQVSEALLGARAALVGDVVGRACEGVDGTNRRTQVRRAKRGGDGEIFVMAHSVAVNQRALRLPANVETRALQN